jgi:A/G-specific adenine glycosylase
MQTKANNWAAQFPRFPISMFQKDLIDWFQKEQRQLPWREDKDPYKIWISEIMLQQTKVDTVIPYFHRFLEKFPTLESLAQANEQDVLKAWEGLGYYSRARNLQEAVKEVVERYSSKVPDNKRDLSELKGVGPYTTGAILSIAYNQPEPAVDGNVMRVLSRIFLLWDDIAKQKTRVMIEGIVQEVIDRELPSDFNQALMELGALICTPKSPACLLCPVQEHCFAFREGVQSELPVKKKKNPPKEKQIRTVVLRDQSSRILIKRRPDTGLLANLWEFPGEEIGGEFSFEREKLERYFYEEFKLRIQLGEQFMEIKHIFSHLVWNIRVYEALTTGKIIENETLRFVKPEELRLFPFPVPYQKIIDNILKG